MHNSIGDNMRDIGIDLGTANILIYVKGEGIVLNEPSVVAIEKDSKKPLAIGEKASLMFGKTPGKYEAIKPMKDGVIADFDITLLMLNYFINKVKEWSFRKPKIIICCPTDTTKVEKNAIREAAERLGAKRVFLEEEPKVAAIGSGLDISKPTGNMIIDIGGGTTDIAVLSLGDIVLSKSLKIAGNSFDADIKNYIKDKQKLLIGERTAEIIKQEIGTVIKNDNKKKSYKVRGRDLVTGLPKTITIYSDEIYCALKSDIEKIISASKMVLEETPPELSADIMENGIILTGGGSLIDGMEKLFSKELGVNVKLSSNPLTSVAEGTGVLLDNLYLLER